MSVRRNGHSAAALTGRHDAGLLVYDDGQLGVVLVIVGGVRLRLAVRVSMSSS